jgi:hypothetical protein
MASRCPRLARSLLGAGLLLAGALTLAGCGPDFKSRGVVKGKVTRGKTPLTSGTVVFFGHDNLTSTAQIDEHGDYVMNDAPVGDVTITVTVNAPPGMSFMSKGEGERWKKIAGEDSKDPSGGGPGIANMSKIPKNVIKVDDKFSKPESSGLKFTVQKGEQTHNIEL